MGTHWAWAEEGWAKFIYCSNGTDEQLLEMNSVTTKNCVPYRDFAGSGVVHVSGAVCALVGCYFIGPRKGRFTRDGRPIDMPGHSIPLCALGGFILLFGFLAFNGGSQVTYVFSFKHIVSTETTYKYVFSKQNKCKFFRI